jgi:toxin ParE1/3/4
VAAPRWRLRLAAEAKLDLAGILEWTTKRFGHRQAAVYAETLTAALTLLANEPAHASVRKRDDIKPGLWLLHLAAIRPRARHLIFYRVLDDGSIAVSRVLHDGMDPRRHLPGQPEDN